MIERLNPPALPPSAGQSQIVVAPAGRTAYLSGQLPLDADGRLVGAGDFRAQTVQVLANLAAALDALEADAANLVKLTIYVVELDAARHGPVLMELLDLAKLGHPAATLVSVHGLARPEYMLEVDAIASLP